MQQASQSEIERCHEEAEAHMRTMLMHGLCAIMRRTGLPPMAVLRLAARSVGSAYREMADAHCGLEPCACGWCPQQTADLEVLIMALMSAGRPHLHDLAAMQAAGSA